MGKKPEKKRYTDPDSMAKAEEKAMAKGSLKEAVATLTSIYKGCEGPDFAGWRNYLEGKLDACWTIEKHLSGDKDYSPKKLQSIYDYDSTRSGDIFNRGRMEVLSWALYRLESGEH